MKRKPAVSLTIGAVSRGAGAAILLILMVWSYQTSLISNLSRYLSDHFYTVAYHVGTPAGTRIYSSERIAYRLPFFEMDGVAENAGTWDARLIEHLQAEDIRLADRNAQTDQKSFSRNQDLRNLLAMMPAPLYVLYFCILVVRTRREFEALEEAVEIPDGKNLGDRGY